MISKNLNTLSIRRKISNLSLINLNNNKTTNNHKIEAIHSPINNRNSKLNQNISLTNNNNHKNSSYSNSNSSNNSVHTNQKINNKIILFHHRVHQECNNLNQTHKVMNRLLMLINKTNNPKYSNSNPITQTKIK